MSNEDGVLQILGALLNNSAVFFFGINDDCIYWIGVLRVWHDKVTFAF